jgi:hypothetical protein
MCVFRSAGVSSMPLTALSPSPPPLLKHLPLQSPFVARSCSKRERAHGSERACGGKHASMCSQGRLAGRQAGKRPTFESLFIQATLWSFLAMARSSRFRVSDTGSSRVVSSSEPPALPWAMDMALTASPASPPAALFATQPCKKQYKKKLEVEVVPNAVMSVRKPTLVT